MKMKKIIKISASTIIVSLMLLMNIMDIFDISNVHELDSISFDKGSFEEIVINDFFAISKGNEFGRVSIYQYFSRDDDRELRSQDNELIEDILTKLKAMKLESYEREVFTGITSIFNKDIQPFNVRKKMYDIKDYDSYVIRFSVPGTSEDISIYINEKVDDYILVESDILTTREEKDKKIIHYEIERRDDIYKVTENKIDKEYIEMLLNSYSENK